MKKLVSALLITVSLMLCLCSCNTFSTDKNSIGKSSNTIKTVHSALLENFKLRKKTGYNLYGVSLVVNSENVGTYTYIYTNKNPKNIKNSDVLVVEVNNRNGKIEKFSAPDQSADGTVAVDTVKNGAVIDLSQLKIDSDEAVKTALKTHFGNDFHYNYVKVELNSQSGEQVYTVSHISLVYNTVFKTQINATTGDVISHGTEEL